MLIKERSSTFRAFHPGSKLPYLYSAYVMVLYLNRTALYILFQKIILGQTSRHFSACSSNKIGLNLDQSTCWSDRNGTEKSCHSADSLESNRNCLEHKANEIETSQATLVFLETSIFTGNQFNFRQ